VKVAYLMSRFPHLPETFILREMDMVKKMGDEVVLFPLVLQKQEVIHPHARRWLEGDDLYRISLAGVVRENVLAFSRKPLRYLRILFQTLTGNLPNIKFFLRSIYIFPSAVAMGARMQALGIGHVHAHYATHPALAAWIIHQFTGIPYSVTVHAHDIFVSQTMLGKKLQSAKFIRAISVFNKKFLIEELGSSLERKIVVIHTGIEPDLYSPRKKKKGAAFRILNIGSLQPYKGQSLLVNACSLLKEKGRQFECVVIGQGELRGSLQELITRSALADCVRLAGGKTEDEVRSLLPGFNCYVQPSIITPSGKMEGIPVAIMEALACAIPVVATAISGIPELVEAGRTGYLVSPGNAAELASAIEKVMIDPVQAGRLAIAGMELVRREFDLSSNVKKLILLFRN
jgi:colanic acid/amylovoran biosynthesis glycosyltransferase